MRGLFAIIYQHSGFRSFCIALTVFLLQKRVDKRRPSLIPIDHVSKLGVLGRR